MGLWDPSSEVTPYFSSTPTQQDMNNWNNSINNIGRSYPKIPRGPFGGKCGAEGSWQATWMIPDITPDACQIHDDCYSDCGKTKQECDIKFYRENSIYGQAVWVGGQSAYDKAQEHCKCSQ